MERLGAWVGKWVAIALVYGAINLVIVGGQHLWHAGDQKRLDMLKQQLAGRKPTLEAAQADLNKKQGQLDAVEAKLLTAGLETASKHRSLQAVKSEAGKLEAALVPGVTQDTYQRYSQAVHRVNALVHDYNGMVSNNKALYGRYKTLLADYNGKVPVYNQQLQDYNGLVHEANGLAKKVGTTWYLVPIPRLGGGKSRTTGAE